MRQISIDQNGEAWDIIWGTSDPDAELRELGIPLAITAVGNRVNFVEPLWGETKVLDVYQTIPSNGKWIALSEITPGVYAVGLKK